MTEAFRKSISSKNICSAWTSVRSSMSEHSTASLLGVGAAMGVGAAAVYFVNKGGMKLKPPVDLNDQTVQFQNGNDEHSRVSRIIGAKGALMKRQFEDAQTLYQCMRRGLRESNNGDCLGYRDPNEQGNPYKWYKYQQVIDRAENVAKGLISRGLKPGQETFVGIFSNNRPEWIFTEQACFLYDMVTVPLYDTLGPEACAFIINQAEIKLVIIDKLAKIKALIDKHDDCPSLETIVCMEKVTDQTVIDSASESGVQIITFSELERGGKDNDSSPAWILPTPESLATICYTSGTTGNAKGVMLTHGNVVADATAMAAWKACAVRIDDVMISFLPLAHMFERILEAGMFTVGARIGFFRGDIKLLTDDIKTLRPTVVPVVPRLLNRIYDRVLAEVNTSALKKLIFKWALSSKEAELQRHIVRNDGLWDKIAFKKVREGMGGRVRLMCTGSAPLLPDVLTFIRAAMGCIVLEGYGQTECVACATVTMEGDHTPGQVGPPIPCCEIKLEDVPDMKYFAKDNKGEVCIRGYNVSQGYFKDPVKTLETFDCDGWLHTGDIGCWTSEGTLKIIDRKKNIFKLAQGEYVAPEKIENIYTRSKYVAQIFVHGDSLKSCVIAVVVPDMEILPSEIKNKLAIEGTPESLCLNSAVKKLVLDDMKSVAKAGGLHSFEQVKDIHMYPDQFTVENDLLTPTFKAKRPQLKEFFKHEIITMYSVLM